LRFEATLGKYFTRPYLKKKPITKKGKRTWLLNKYPNVLASEKALAS
jgi:hypothetical protein